VEAGKDRKEISFGIFCDILLAVNGFVAFLIKKGRPLPPVMFLIVSGSNLNFYSYCVV
jgi:hypothetical protein